MFQLVCLDREGNLLSPNQWFDTCGYFRNGYAFVELNKKEYTLDIEGNLYDYDTKQPLGINIKNTKMNESKVIRLTESDLRLMIEKCISNILYS